MKQRVDCDWPIPCQIRGGPTRAAQIVRPPSKHQTARTPSWPLKQTSGEQHIATPYPRRLRVPSQPLPRLLRDAVVRHQPSLLLLLCCRRTSRSPYLSACCSSPTPRLTVPSSGLPPFALSYVPPPSWRFSRTPLFPLASPPGWTVAPPVLVWPSEAVHPSSGTQS